MKSLQVVETEVKYVFPRSCLSQTTAGLFLSLLLTGIDEAHTVIISELRPPSIHPFYPRQPRERGCRRPLHAQMTVNRIHFVGTSSRLSALGTDVGSLASFSKP